MAAITTTPLTATELKQGATLFGSSAAQILKRGRWVQGVSDTHKLTPKAIAESLIDAHGGAIKGISPATLTNALGIVNAIDGARVPKDFHEDYARVVEDVRAIGAKNGGGLKAVKQAVQTFDDEFGEGFLAAFDDENPDNADVTVARERATHLLTFISTFRLDTDEPDSPAVAILKRLANLNAAAFESENAPTSDDFVAAMQDDTLRAAVASALYGWGFVQDEWNENK